MCSLKTSDQNFSGWREKKGRQKREGRGWSEGERERKNIQGIE